MNRILDKKKRFLLVFFVWVTSSSLFAQDQEKRMSVFEEAKNDAHIILGTTAAGAVIGLSTLSFSSDPGEDVDHIIVGGALGIIVGVVMVTWKQLDQKQQFYERNNSHTDYSGFTTAQRLAWHRLKHRGLTNTKRPVNMAYSFSF